jgi:uncharacterized protein GlcG (DUF336 family)
MSALTLAQASIIVDAALKKARETNLAPLAVAVLDSGGHLVAFKREDKAGILRFDIAFAKAWGALGMGFGSRTLASRGGNVIGACGISGDTSDKDEICAVAGIEAAELKAEPGMD